MKEPTGATDLETSGDAPTGERVLLVIDGAPVQVFSLPRSGRVCIGRGDDVDVLIKADSLSRRHCELILAPDSITVRDLASENGTQIGELHLRQWDSAPLRVGVPFTAGGVTLMVQARTAARPLSPSARRASFDEAVRRLAASKLPVLLVGEAGVEKEQTAEQIHDLSPRRAGSFVRIQCDSLDDARVERELFGSETDRIPGLIEAAHGGTVLLVEIDCLALRLQTAVARVLDEKVIARAGGTRTRPIDIRMIATAREDLMPAVVAGRMLRELAFKFGSATLIVPPLRDRRDEISEIAERMLAAAVPNGSSPMLTREARDWITDQDWPGNLHELRNTCERAALLAGGTKIEQRHLTQARDSGPRAEERPSHEDLAKERDKRRVLDALAQCGGNQSRAAELLGISRRTLVSRLGEYGIARPLKRDDE